MFINRNVKTRILQSPYEYYYREKKILKVEKTWAVDWVHSIIVLTKREEKGAKFMGEREWKRRQDTCWHFWRAWRERHGRDQGHTHRRDALDRATHPILLLPNALSPPRSSSVALSPLLLSTGISPIALRLHQPESINWNSIINNNM